MGDTDLQAALRTVADLAKRTIPGTGDASVTLVRNAAASTAAFTGDLALRLDESQYESGYGPCLDAAAAGSTVSVPDMAVETRWPRWTKQALNHGVCSSLSSGLPVHNGVTGAINLYAIAADAFDEDSVVLARTFAGYAAVALATAHLDDATVTLTRQLQAAMNNRAVIEQAKGVIMGDRHCGADEAYAILTKLSRDTDRKLRDVAATVVQQATKRE